MFSWLKKESVRPAEAHVIEVTEALRRVYNEKLLPLEQFTRFHEFHSAPLTQADFSARPMILLVGQYSTGKTTFIRYLLEQDFPGMRIGPEPTTDRFIAVMKGDAETVIPGNALVVDTSRQFIPMSKFGNAFLNRLQASLLDNPVLDSCTIIDTPGILSGEKQRINRGYNFSGVLEWLAGNVDRIILLFDAHKLDISDEFRWCIEALHGNEDKIRIVLNKADQVDHQQLMRVYGALMWSLGKVFHTPEVYRVYVGSFWDKPLSFADNRRLFEDEQHDLFKDLQGLPKNATIRKLNDLIKRARLLKIHALLMDRLYNEMPTMIGKDKRKKELIAGLDKIYDSIRHQYGLSEGDFPDVNRMRAILSETDFSKLQPVKHWAIEKVDHFLTTDIARIMDMIPKENAKMKQKEVHGGAFDGVEVTPNPFEYGKGEGIDVGRQESVWIVGKDRWKWDEIFQTLLPIDGKITGSQAKSHMIKSKLPNHILGKIWKLSDIDKDGMLTADEFALANYLINLKLDGYEIPQELPAHLIPPKK